MEGRGLHALLEETRTSGAQHQRPLSPLGRPAHVSIVRQPPWRGDRQSRAPLVTSFHDKADEAGAPHPPHLSVDVRHTGIAHQTLPRSDGVDVVDGWAADGWLPESLTLGEPIGRGTFGVVRGAACNKTGRQYAVKVLKKRRYGYPAHLLRARIDNEVSVWRDLQVCKDVVRLLKCYEDDEHVYLVQEHCTGGTLEDHMKASKQLMEHEAAHVTAAILRMVANCHQLNICYGDIKPANFLVRCPCHSGSSTLQVGSRQLQVKATDFGSAQRTKPGKARLSGENGTPLYTAPEVQEPPYGLESDVWSVGVLLYQMLCGKPPFVSAVAKTMRELNPASLAYAIAYVQLTFDSEPWKDISNDAKDLISKMLERDVSSRITAEDALKHPWIIKHLVEGHTEVRGNIVVNGAGYCKTRDSENMKDVRQYKEDSMVNGPPVA